MSGKTGGVILSIMLVVVAIAGYRYVDYRSENAVSDAAFIRSDRIALLSFKVGGKIVEMRKRENRHVSKGEIIALIDPVDLSIEAHRVESEIESMDYTIESLRLRRDRVSDSLKIKTKISENEYDSAVASIESLRLKIEASEVKLRKLGKDKARYADLYGKKLVAQSGYEDIESGVEELEKSIESMYRSLIAQERLKDKARNALKLAQLDRRRVVEIDKSIESAERKREALKAGLESIEKRIAYTKLVVPFDGIVARRFFDPPKVVSKGSPVYAIEDPDSLYCEVLLSEKKLSGVKPGCSCLVEVDASGGEKITGTVESIAPVSASTFSLVPRDIASGEFTKLDQRFKVRISLDETTGLRSGMGASVAIRRCGNGLPGIR